MFYYTYHTVTSHNFKINYGKPKGNFKILFFN